MVEPVRRDKCAYACLDCCSYSCFKTKNNRGSHTREHAPVLTANPLAGNVPLKYSLLQQSLSWIVCSQIHREELGGMLSGPIGLITLSTEANHCSFHQTQNVRHRTQKSLMHHLEFEPVPDQLLQPAGVSNLNRC